MKLSIVVPVYNEERTIVEIVERIRAVPLDGIEKEIVIANDGSEDGTRRAIDASAWRQDPRIKVYDSVINLGKGAAVRLGFRHATGDIVLTQDADLELDPNDYGALLAPILQGRADVVYGSRFMAGQNRVPLKTRVANGALTWTTNILYAVRLTDMETGYKAFRREVLGTIRLRSVGFDFEPEITAKLLRAGHRIVEVPVKYDPRDRGAGKKIRWVDGVDALYTLFKHRFT
jgi:glycosyltransferase involved in cell wall biosynthesis